MYSHYYFLKNKLRNLPLNFILNMSERVISTIDEAESFLYNSLPVFQRQGPAAYKADIGNIVKLMEFAGNPHLAPIKFIHIAGTNGKGSVTHLIAAYLQCNGYKTGVYTSPHYQDIRERIKVNGILIPEQDFISCLNFFMPVIDSIKPSFFELICAMAFLYFKNERVDYAVIETGMGGRLDSTNILSPIMSVITNISFDHQLFLGDTLEKIAYEKAGIIKKKTPVIIGQKNAETQPVFESKAAELNAPIYFAENYWHCTLQKTKILYTNYKVTKLTVGTAEIYPASLHGYYQEENIRTFFEVCRQLDSGGHINFHEVCIRKALKNVVKLTYFIGRWQLIHKLPRIILESAHNLAGIKAVSEQLKELKYTGLYIIFGTVADKDVGPVLALLPKEASYVFTKAEIPRAMDEQILQKKASEIGFKGISKPNVNEAMKYVLNQCKTKDLVLITGSIFVVGDAMKFIQEDKFYKTFNLKVV